MSDANAELERQIPLARAGSSDAMGLALEHFRSYLLAIANRELDADLRAKGGASDIVQETFLEAQRDFGQFAGSTAAELRGWLVRLMTNNLANFARSYRSTAKRALDREVGLPGEEIFGPSGGGLAGKTPTPSVEAMSQEQETAVERAIQRLPEDYRQVILLRNREDRGFDDIATIMGRSENAVRKLWFRAVEQLQQELDAKP